MSDTHAAFLANLDASQDTVWAVARWLQGRGNPVRVNPVQRSPTHEQWREFTDGGDLVIEQRIEVKRRSLDFTDGETFPFPDVLVCAVHSWERAFPKPFSYVLVNRLGTHAAIVSKTTRPHWVARRVHDPRYGNAQDGYFCPTSMVRFVKLEP